MNVKSIIIGLVLGLAIAAMTGAVIARNPQCTTFAIDQYVPHTTATGELILVDLSSATARYVRIEDTSVPADAVKVR